MPLNQFYDSADALSIFEMYYNSVVVRAVPTAEGKQRFTLIDQPLKEVIEELKAKVPEESVSDYLVVLNEYDPSQYCGVVVSDNERLVIEMVEEPNLENLCHGKVIPWSAEFKKGYNSFGRMEFKNVEGDKIKEKMWNVVKRLSTVEQEGGIPHYEPRKGYFEFVYSQKDGSLRFIDYKKTF
jgi:hypothetical protein